MLQSTPKITNKAQNIDIHYLSNHQFELVYFLSQLFLIHSDPPKSGFAYVTMEHETHFILYILWKLKTTMPFSKLHDFSGRIFVCLPYAKQLTVSVYIAWVCKCVYMAMQTLNLTSEHYKFYTKYMNNSITNIHFSSANNEHRQAGYIWWKFKVYDIVGFCQFSTVWSSFHCIRQMHQKWQRMHTKQKK